MLAYDKQTLDRRSDESRKGGWSTVERISIVLGALASMATLYSVIYLVKKK